MSTQRTPIEQQIVKAVEGEIDECYECHEYTGELMSFSLVDGRVLDIMLDRSEVQLTGADGTLLSTHKIKVTLE